MKLYHGTTLSRAEKVLKTGILPRAYTGNSTWERTLESNPECVYLTSIYGGYFAQAACDSCDDEGANEQAALIEIDTSLLDTIKMRPDEDFLEQATRGQKPGDYDIAEFRKMPGGRASMAERTRFFRNRLHKFAALWEKSVEWLGTCAHEGIISPDAITKIVTWDQTNRSLLMATIQPSITIVNKMTCSTRYEQLTRWLMGEPVTADEMNHPWTREKVKEIEGPNRQIMLDQLDAADRALQNREGWAVVYERGKNLVDLVLGTR